MARIRNIRPDFFQHSGLHRLGKSSGLGLAIPYSFAGLWTQSDCQGVFKWDALMLQVQILPWEGIEFELVLEALEGEGYVRRFEGDDGEPYGWIPKFQKHQAISGREA